MDNIFTSTKCLSSNDIQRYLKEELNEADQYRVENHLLDCELCSDAVEGLSNHYNFDENLELKWLKKEIKEHDIPNINSTKNYSNVKSKVKSSSRRRRIVFGSVAAAILLLLLPTAAHFYWQETEGERMFQSFYQAAHNDAPLAQRANSVIDFTNPNIKKGMDYFNLKEYRESLGYYQEVLKHDPTNNTALFFSGLASIELGNQREAINFLTVSRLNHVDFYEAATWYLILAHLKQNNTVKAKELIEDLVNSKETPYRQKALELRAEMKTVNGKR